MIGNKVLLFLCLLLIGICTLMLICIGRAGGYNVYTIIAISGIYTIAGDDDPTQEFIIYEDNSTTPRTGGEFMIDLQKSGDGFEIIATSGDKIYLTGYEKTDGINYRRFDQAEFQAGSIGNNGIFKNIMTQHPIKYTAKTSADRGAFKLPYNYTYRNEQ